jgi:hypothetical protein
MARDRYSLQLIEDYLIMNQFEPAMYKDQTDKTEDRTQSKLTMLFFTVAMLCGLCYLIYSIIDLLQTV